MTEGPDKPPFTGHRSYYLVLKIAVLAVGLGLALRYLLG
jgi:hypothetical protein